MNRDGHLLGATLFIFVYWIIATENTIAVLFASCIFSCLGGLMPDILEPPTWPGHRGFFHYFVGFLSVIPAIFLINSSTLFFLGGAFCFGYFSHFILDIL